ncbi:HNH endonuclease signature motif containing protein [Schauerella aestuarii]|uniref:HNH endonuclease signature motif containing protein n=1 Tax=Schauerella aestuarii TaxID=2511204 RepID=UPI00136E11BD|nr:HNH endonuclease [Achromobacter aestuarii]
MNTKEVWRLIPSVDGLIASSEGRLMVLPRISPLPKGGFRQYGGEPTTGQWDGKRFLYVHKGKTFKAHRLICEAFNGPPKQGQVCMHLDENSSNNKPTNLAWGSQKENLNAPGFLAYCRSRTGENSPTTKFRNRQAEILETPPCP